MSKTEKGEPQKDSPWYNKVTTTKLYQGDNNMKRRNLQLTLPINTEILVATNDSVRLLDEITDKLNYSKLIDSYSRFGRHREFSPKLLFKIIAYSRMNQIFSSRKIEKACKRDINFMWLLGGHKAPDHNTINRFQRRLEPFIEELFYELVIHLEKMNEINFDNIFIDGTKIEANANKYTFVWKKSTKKHQSRLQENLKVLLEDLSMRYEISFTPNEIIGLEDIDKLLGILYEQKSALNIEFVYGKGKRKHQIQNDIEALEQSREKQAKYDKYNATFDGRNSFSKTDKDATFMRMKNDHMRNSQLKPGYNIQIGVEGEYIAMADISSERSDQLTLIPLLDNFYEHTKKRYKTVVADAGYESEENYAYLMGKSQNCYIKPSNYEQSKKKKYKKNIKLRENMDYDSTTDTYTCYNNKKISHIYNTKRKYASGYEAVIKVYECESCEGCPYKSKCTRAKHNRKLYVSEAFIGYRNSSTENIMSPQGIKLRVNRSIQVEGAFGVLKQDYGFRRFLTRGKKNVKTEFLLLCFAYNINKLHQKKMHKKNGVIMHEVNIA